MTSSTLPEASGIYKITCITTGKFYIGSAVNLRNRWRQHYNELLRNNHSNQKMQNAWNKHTEATFIFEVIEYTLPPFLLEREQFYFDTLCPFDDKGFNIYRIAGSPYGREVSQSTKDKIGNANRGRRSPNLGKKASLETRQKIGLARLGRKTSPETKEKLSHAQTGKKFSPESLERRTRSRIGFKHSVETRERLRQVNLGKYVGRKLSPEHIEKVRQANLGKKHSPEECERNKERNRVHMKTLFVTFPDGTEHTVTGIREFCKEHGLNPSHLIEVAQGKSHQHKGYKARYAN